MREEFSKRTKLEAFMRANGRYSYDYLAERFSYDPETGFLRWKNRPRSHFSTDSGWRCFNTREAGTLAGSPAVNLYLRLRVDQIGLLVHRIAWVLGTGCDISKGRDVDHINGDRADNRLENLRLATRSQNNANSKKRNRPLPKGIHFDRARQKYMAYVSINGRSIRKRFTCLNNAVEFLDAARSDLHGAFANPGDRHAP